MNTATPLGAWGRSVMSLVLTCVLKVPGANYVSNPELMSLTNALLWTLRARVTGYSTTNETGACRAHTHTAKSACFKSKPNTFLVYNGTAEERREYARNATRSRRRGNMHSSTHGNPPQCKLGAVCYQALVCAHLYIYIYGRT